MEKIKFSNYFKTYHARSDDIMEGVDRFGYSDLIDYNLYSVKGYDTQPVSRVIELSYTCKDKNFETIEVLSASVNGEVYKTSNFQKIRTVYDCKTESYLLILIFNCLDPDLIAGKELILDIEYKVHSCDSYEHYSTIFEVKNLTLDTVLDRINWDRIYNQRLKEFGDWELKLSYRGDNTISDVNILTQKTLDEISDVIKNFSSTRGVNSNKEVESLSYTRSIKSVIWRLIIHEPSEIFRENYFNTISSCIKSGETHGYFN